MATTKLYTVLAALLVATGVITTYCFASSLHGLAAAQPWTSTVSMASAWVHNWVLWWHNSV